ncbi:glycosyltransferase family 4 protein [Mycolicibacterium komossense]|uniref:Glycosyltransferase family 4 protein n=1 Tax=Mycolicibacterium komossense TaxID=1779 RepID=A0ABT3CDF1_9MYCO|nr:glycosyltransferase family 4 protein [Mycolicibacterium komossense]MCV7227514.1 glycosyltransferase family 4 protein [Mycolicibacterium komossense]
MRSALPDRRGGAKRVLILVENLPSPFDRRVWQEATTLHAHGWQVSIICPTGKGYEQTREIVDGIYIYRYRLPTEGNGALSYLAEYSTALWHTFRLAFKVRNERGFDVVHACNPPDFLFLVGGFFKIFAKTRFLFDHHDINPELYEAKFGRRDIFWKLMVWLERATFRTADISIATNESYRRIAIERGGMDPQRVFVVRSGPMLDRLKIVPAKPALKCGRKYLVGYVGVMGKQEGIDLLLLAAKHIVEDMGREDVHFGLVGGGTSLDEMQRLAVTLGVADYVTFTGRVPDDELLDMLNSADVCVNPDVANEMNDKSTMNKIMEYMALGKPIVQFDLTEGRYSAGEASLYAAKNDAVDMAQKITELLDDPERRERMGAFGLTRVQDELAWEYEVPNLLRAYDAVIAGTKP